MGSKAGLALAILPLALAACEDKPKAPPPMGVSYAVAKAQNTPLYREYVGQIQAQNDVAIRPRVSGLVVSRSFIEGGFVKQGQTLFVIDPREYDAQVAQARAQLASAQASAARAQQDVARYAPLVKADAIAGQVYDTAVQTARAANAQVQAANATVEQARIALSYTVVRSPMNGQIGRAEMDVGSLVSPTGPEMTRVSDLNPMTVYFNPSEDEVLEYQKKSVASQTAEQSSIILILADGTEYPARGRVDFADRALNPQTGALEVRAVFPNPGGVLRPGMFGRIKLQFGDRPDAIVVPDKAVVEQLGTRFVYVVGEGNKVEQRQIQAGPHIGGTWIINSGIKPGEKVLVDGQQKVQPGMVVSPQLAKDGG